MTICPIALAIGCEKCPAFKFCPLTYVLGDQQEEESFPTAEEEVIPEKKKPLTKDERLALIKKSAVMVQPVKVFRPDTEGNLRLVRVISRNKSFDERLRNRGR